MNKKKLAHYKKMLLMHKNKILNGGILRSNEDLEIPIDDLHDEGDLASNTVNQQVSFHMRQIELEKLRAIEDALEKIEDGTYGYCEECDCLIPEKRLKLYPWATLCIEHAEMNEREKNKYNKAI